MVTFILRRILILIPLLIMISIISFTIIQLPSGDYMSYYIARLKAASREIDEAEIGRLTRLYGLDQPLPVQYFRWIRRIVFEGDLGFSFSFNKPVREVIGERILLTMVISLITMLFTYAVAIPIGIYSATHQYSFVDYVFTFIGFIGLATPSFLLALIVVWLLFSQVQHLGHRAVLVRSSPRRPGASPRCWTCSSTSGSRWSSSAWREPRASSASCAPPCSTS